MFGTITGPALAALTAPLWLALPGLASEDADPSGRADARATLAAAKQSRRTAFKKTGEEKRKILEQTVAAYRLVLQHHEDEGDLCAEAAFRIGEIERSLGDAPAARAAFEQTVSRRDDAPRFAARALNELGHLARRAGDLEAALETYRRVPSEFPAQDAEAVKALTWGGKMLLQLDRGEDARTMWLSIGRLHPSEPVAAVRAADLASQSALDEGDRALARKILEETEAHHSESNLEQEWWSPEVERAVSKMKVRARLDESDDS